MGDPYSQQMLLPLTDNVIENYFAHECLIAAITYVVRMLDTCRYIIVYAGMYALCASMYACI